MKVRFTEDFDYRPTPACTIAYKAGMVETVKRACGEDAVAKGKAVEVMPRGRKAKAVKEEQANGDQQ
ncbi:hypothetical protein [Rhizobium oryziradicis]|uniref:Uncharacterized protein n=1 Tax=Rhizobium oryziradicis TaxID=1867956 RepID=A0A1Q8ZRQ4_9HYPH|nr:hypothetical protein [Rhizobium oryziradicis]OLP44736.1 hypothetical protein BJF95_09660 [Rhizobium oryziradicis]